MAEFIKNPRRLKPVVGFGADLPRKARKRGVNLSLRRDRNVAKARRAEARELKLEGRALRRNKAAADTQSAIIAKADRDNRLQLWLEAKAAAEAKAKAEADAKAKAKAEADAKAKASLVLRPEVVKRTKDRQENLRQGVKALATARRRAATLVKRSKDFFREYVIARPARPAVSGTVGK